MLNKFQQDILTYLEATNGHFISCIMENSDTDFIVIDHMIPDLLTYLDSMIRRDLDLHERKSKGYEHLQNMLIEVHLGAAGEFSAALAKVALDPIRQRQL